MYYKKKSLYRTEPIIIKDAYVLKTILRTISFRSKVTAPFFLPLFRSVGKKFGAQINWGSFISLEGLSCRVFLVVANKGVTNDPAYWKRGCHRDRWHLGRGSREKKQERSNGSGVSLKLFWQWYGRSTFALGSGFRRNEESLASSPHFWAWRPAF